MIHSQHVIMKKEGFIRIFGTFIIPYLVLLEWYYYVFFVFDMGNRG
jgi:hypothetical protein